VKFKLFAALSVVTLSLSALAASPQENLEKLKAIGGWHKSKDGACSVFVGVDTPTSGALRLVVKKSTDTNADLVAASIGLEKLNYFDDGDQLKITGESGVESIGLILDRDGRLLKAYGKVSLFGPLATRRSCAL
jgi:hypothetical protein